MIARIHQSTVEKQGLFCCYDCQHVFLRGDGRNEPSIDMLSKKRLLTICVCGSNGFWTHLGGFFNRLGLTPNMMTMLGLMGNTIGAYYLASGEMLTGGFLSC